MSKYIAALLLLVFSITTNAQQSLIVDDPFQEFLKAKQFFETGQYNHAYVIFKKLQQYFVENKPVNEHLYKKEVDFYNIACALMNRELGIEYRAKEFIIINEDEPLAGMMHYYLGDYYFYKKEYVNASESFEKAPINNLNNVEISNMKFEQGYSYFALKQFKLAKPLLDAVRQIKTDPHYTDANYYYGLLCFQDKQYRQALDAFEIARTDEQYRPLLPYYLASINYIMGDKDKAIQQAEAALKTGDLYYNSQLKQLVGHALFEKKEFAKALPYLEQYINENEKVRREDLYELAYCYYDSKQYAKCIDKFKPLSGGQDSLSQHAMYLLGDAYLKTGDKVNARNAFLFCSTNSSNAIQKEISLFNYGKLSYELGFDNEALNTLRSYTTKYPRSSNIAEANDLLIGVLARTSNYKEALELYDNTNGLSDNSKKQYPKILYNRAQELINDGRTEEAEKLLDKALTVPYNQEVAQPVQFWKGELNYRKGDKEKAIVHYANYLRNPVANGEANRNNAQYGLGYAYLNQENYTASLKEFEALQSAKLSSLQQEQDVTLRIADIYYMKRDYNKAKGLYQGIINVRPVSADYATFQNAMISGAQNKNAEKINALRLIETSYPSSSLIDDSHMEIANTYLSSDQYAQAIPYLQKIIDNTKEESFKPEAYLKSGISYYNTNNNAEALNQFKTLLNKYPQTSEAEDALDNIKSIFIEEGRPDEYITFVQSTGRTINYSTADSLTYASIELQLTNGNKEAALPALKNYISKYPDGKNIIIANYHAAEISREKQDWVNADLYFGNVAAKAPNKFAEKSMLAKARINYFEQKDYAKSTESYKQLKQYASTQENKLEAMRGLVRCQYSLGQYADAVQNASELLKEKGIGNDDKTFAYLVLAKDAQQKGNLAEAIKQYNQVAALSKAEFGAEARYQIAVCLYEQNKLPEAEKAAFDMIKKSGSYEVWVTKSYILLGDIYMKQKDYFNAKATYKSVVENATIPELKKEAEEKLAKAEAEDKTKLNFVGEN